MPQCRYESHASSDTSILYMTSADQQQALRVLGERRLWDPEYKRPNSLSKLFKSKTRQENFRPREIDRALRAAVEENAPLGLIEAYISFGASVGIRPTNRLWKRVNRARPSESDALQLAVRGGSDELFRLLAAHADQESKNEAVVTTIHLHDQPKTQMLFDLGADLLVFDAAICRAAARLDKETLSFLSHWTFPSGDVYTLAFARAIQAGDQWHSDIGLNVLRLLLEKGAQGDVVGMAFLQAVKLFLLERAPEALVDLLLAFDADVDFNKGEALKRTIVAGEINLLEKLMHSDPSEDTVTEVLYFTLICRHPPELFVEISEILTTGYNQPDWNWRPAPDLPLLILALQEYPTSPVVVRRFLEMGSEVDSELSWQVLFKPSLQEEDVETDEVSPELANVLTWACCQGGEQAISSDVVEVLLEFNGKCSIFSNTPTLLELTFPADCNYTTASTLSTPLQLASRRGRHDLVGLLLQQSINVSAKNYAGCSPLYCAARAGDIDSVHLLTEMQARVNDGSLHEAARQLDHRIVSVLVDAGHDPNFTSTKHNGLTPLGELAMYCQASGSESAAEECIDLLVRAGADPLKKWRGETVLYNALQNPDPYPITTVLLERLFWEYLNHEANVCSRQDFFYSPTMFLQKGYFAGSETDRRALIQLLKDHGAEDNYYAAEGLRQPSDAVGVPYHILEFERRRQRHEEEMRRRLEEHQATLRQELELAEQRLTLGEAHQQQSLRHHWESAEQDYEVQEIQQQQYLRHQGEWFEDQEYRTITMAHTRAQIQEQDDYRRIQSELESLEIEYESSCIRIEEENHMLEIQWQINEAQAQSARDEIVTQQQLRYIDEARWDDMVASNYQIQEQNVMARGLVAMIDDRSHPGALAALQEAIIAKFTEECPNSQVLQED